MKRRLLLSLILALSFVGLQAQVTDTYIVTDNPNLVSSCDDTLITLADIYELCGIHDLNDPADDVSKYRILELNGSLITSNVISGPFHYSEYTQVYVEKTGTTFNGHNGVVIHINIITPPTSLFDADTLKYVVERGEKVNYVEDFFAHFNFFSSGKDLVPLGDRIFFTDMGLGTELPITSYSDWAFVGAGLYRVRVSVSKCFAADVLVDSIFIKVTETPCHNISIRNLPGLCLSDVFDLTPYVYLDGVVATPAQIADMTFTDKSYLPNQSLTSTFNPSAMDMSAMYVSGSNYPIIGVSYAPNVALAPGTVCQTFSTMLNTKIPAKFYITNVIFVNDDYGNSRNFNIDGNYYSFNNVFHKNVLDKLYIDNFDFFSGTILDVYSDAALTSQVSNPDLSPGDYYIKATNPACSGDQSVFNIHVIERDYDISWQHAQALGTGYYTFNVPAYAGATYGWFVWGGSIVSGIGTDQITVYFSQNSAPYITVSCNITVPAIRSNSTNTLSSAVYLTPDGNGNLEEIPQGVTTGTNSGMALENVSVFPNPSEGTITIAGEGMYEVKVFNAMGQQVYEDPAYTANVALNIKSKGVHVIQLLQNGRRGMLKVIVQ